MVTLGLSVGRGANEPKRKWSNWATKLLSKWRGRYCLYGSRQHYANRNGEICRVLPGSEGLASLMISMLIEQLRSYGVWETSMQSQVRKRARWANAL